MTEQQADQIISLLEDLKIYQMQNVSVTEDVYGTVDAIYNLGTPIPSYLLLSVAVLLFIFFKRRFF